MRITGLEANLLLYALGGVLGGLIGGGLLVSRGTWLWWYGKRGGTALFIIGCCAVALFAGGGWYAVFLR